MWKERAAHRRGSCLFGWPGLAMHEGLHYEVLGVADGVGGAWRV